MKYPNSWFVVPDRGDMYLEKSGILLLAALSPLKGLSYEEEAAPPWTADEVLRVAARTGVARRRAEARARARDAVVRDAISNGQAGEAVRGWRSCGFQLGTGCNWELSIRNHELRFFWLGRACFHFRRRG